jgi:chromosome segregation protein
VERTTNQAAFGDFAALCYAYGNALAGGFMLKRLELVGFKSFADKTTFDFGDGITGIVGPNGSGKSNIVDAVRWLMGEQSAKSLRGGEMADVIFNGSASRRSLGLAEVTMTFDNRRHQLALETDEVQITRRVYRDGEGEYLINGQKCRLRDIKELFLGSGAGHDAYCIIEQGRVDVLLQASTKDRRAIFEEAAGISRFKAKKTETLRKLEHVDQNLQRLQDIIDEVEKQLRSVKLQAAKAQRYQEYSERLKELRLGLGQEEYRQLSQKLDAEVQVIEELRVDLDQRAARAGACEAESGRLEMLLADLEDALRDHEARLARVQQEIKAEETTLSHEGALTTDLEAELDRTRRRLAELTTRLGALSEANRQAETELTAAETQASSRRLEAVTLEDDLQSTVARLAALGEQVSADKNEHLEQMRRAAHLQNEAVASRAHVDNLHRERDRLRHRSEQAAESLASVDSELQDLVRADEQLQRGLAAARLALDEKRQERDRLRQVRDETVDHVSGLRQQRSGLASRIEVLGGLIRSHEGLGTGVREVFSLIEQPEPGPWSTILGMIADFLTVKREYAALIDLALGDWAQRFIVRDPDKLVEALAARSQPLAGRVSFLPLLPVPTDNEDPALAALRANRQVEVSLLSRLRQTGAPPPAPEHPGLVAPAVQLVSCENPDLADLPAQLLGRTLIVRDLATARALAGHAAGFRLVTLQGELLEPDGTVTVGIYHGESGILSRKSELRELLEQMTRLDQCIAETESDLSGLRERIDRLDADARDRQKELEVLTEQAADLHARALRHRDKRQGLHEEVAVHRDELQRIEQEAADLERTWQEARDQAAAAEAQVVLLHARLHEAEEEIRRRERERHEKQLACTQSQVALAKTEERLAALRSRHQQFTRDLHQRRQEHEQSRQGVGHCQARLTESQRTMLRASSNLAQAYLDKEAAQRQVGELAAQREQKRQDRARLAQQAQTVRTEWRSQQELFHARELEANNLRHRRDTLVLRLREDYQIDLALLASSGRAAAPAEPAEPALPLDPAAVNQEIEELRRKLSRLGSVNLDSLQELHELETRRASLQAQFDDLTGAKKTLEEIIAKINLDSRRLFIDSFTAVRAHFQELFRKLFGGGMADIMLEDESDVLESGVEIIARPPGKELRSISLMSGGEKTLTAVALLLAVFRSKPSPFCLLDEVDAALDEANIGRYCDVLREFQQQSQFIIVTHSKKTMAATDVLYGITMQESGISKQVAVRFEDWVEDGQAGTNGHSAAGNGQAANEAQVASR